MIFKKAEVQNKLLNCLLFMKYNSIGVFTFVFPKVYETFFSYTPPHPNEMKLPVLLHFYIGGRDFAITLAESRVADASQIIPQKNPVEKQLGPCLYCK
jgi:hypothetical protein